MTDTLAESLAREIHRVRALQEIYKELRKFPNVICEPQIAMMEASIRAAVDATISGDVVEMLHAHADLKQWEK